MLIKGGIISYVIHTYSSKIRTFQTISYNKSNSFECFLTQLTKICSSKYTSWHETHNFIMEVCTYYIFLFKTWVCENISGQHPEGCFGQVDKEWVGHT